MRVIALFGRVDIGKPRCLGHLINLIHSETKGCDLLYEGQDMRVTLNYNNREASCGLEYTEKAKHYVEVVW